MIDLLLASIIGIAVLLGLLRGMVGIIAPIVSWVLAGWVALQYGRRTAFWIAGGGAPSMLEYAGGYALCFVVVLILGFLLGLVLKSAVRSTRISELDRALGAAVGLVGGVAVACLAIVLIGYSPLTSDPSWRQSRIRAGLSPAVSWLQSRMPEVSMPDMPDIPMLGNGNKSGEQPQNGRLPLPGLDQAISQLLNAGKPQQAQQKPIMQDPARIDGAPMERDPAAVNGNEVDPANVNQRR
ncbi:MAG: CvpA family protein [Xanthomonadaceae bacterium]|nr:CvpA family protein [Xanthomonadaceae bacterium]